MPDRRTEPGSGRPFRFGEGRNKLNRLGRDDAENRKERSFTLYSDGRQPGRASVTTDEPPDWNTQGAKLYGSVERATRRKA